MRFARLIRVVTLVATLMAWRLTAKGAEECTGDCGGDGKVTIDEVVEMVALAQMRGMETSAGLITCQAADRNRDGAVSIDEIIGAIRYALNGCPSAVTVTVAPVSAAPGMNGRLSVSVGTGGERIVAVQQELRFPAEAAVAATTDGQPDCDSANPYAKVAFLPPGCGGTLPCEAIRVTYAPSPQETDIAEILDGTLYSCSVHVAGTAAVGARLPMSCRNVTAVYETEREEPSPGCHDRLGFEERSVACVDGFVQVTAP